MNKKNFGLIIIIIIFIIISAFLFFKDNHKFNNNSIVIFPLENLNSTGNKYLGYSDGYLYFLKSYNIDELYVIKSENNKNISNDIITKAKTKIEENKKTFSVENETYNVVNLFDALYLKDSNISVTLDYIEKQFSVFIEKRIITDELPIEISINKKTDNFKKVYTSLYEDEIYTKGLELKNIASVGDEYPSDYIIYRLVNAQDSLYNVEDVSDSLIGIDAYEFDKNNYLIVKKINDNYRVKYYLYLQKIDEFNEEYGF